ncbi:MAG: Panacea domain-containing protein [Methanobacteriaceae archaeon]
MDILKNEIANNKNNNKNNNNEYNKDKLKELVHYIIEKCNFKSNVGRTVLYKLLYFSDFNYYELYKVSITNESYLKFSRGPVSSNFNSVKSELIEEEKITELIKPFKESKYYMFEYRSLKTPKIKYLNRNELDIVDFVINQLGSMKAIEITDYSHGDSPWKMAKIRGELRYEDVLYRDKKHSIIKNLL